MRVLLRAASIFAVLCAVSFAALAIWGVARAIFLGWSAIADPSVAALAAGLSYVALAALAVSLTSWARDEANSRKRGGGSIRPEHVKAVAQFTAKRPATTLMLALAAGAIAEQLQSRGRPEP